VGINKGKWLTCKELPPVIEDLRKHTPEQLAELRLLLNAGLLERPDSRRPSFFEIDGAANVYYILRYPLRHKVLLVAAWHRQSEPVVEFVACT
jgi:hypothetical protein